MYLKYNYNYYLCSKFIINNLCPAKFKLAIIQNSIITHRRIPCPNLIFSNTHLFWYLLAHFFHLL